MIPKIIYLTYKDNNIPEEIFTRWRNLNKDYTIKFYDDSNCFIFIKNNFGEEYANYFSEIKIGPYKADFWRLCILYIYGGIYTDIDIVPIQPISKIIENSDLCTCLAMNKRSIFQAFIAVTPKNELIKLCLESFYSKRKNKDFLKDLKDCAPTFDMYNVFCQYLNRLKIKANKKYYINNQVIKILQEQGSDYLNAFVSFRGLKLFLSRNIDYVNHRDGKKCWNKNINYEISYPLGNYNQTSTNFIVKDNIFLLDCLNRNNNYISNKVLIKDNAYYENLNGFLYIRENNDIKHNIPQNVYQLYPSNILKKEGFNYFVYNEKERENFMEKNFPSIYKRYKKLPQLLKNYIWSLCIIYHNGGIYIDNKMSINSNLNKFIGSSNFMSSIDKLNNINFHYFSSVKGNEMLIFIVKNFINCYIKKEIVLKTKIINIGSSNKLLKIIKVPGIIKCNNIAVNNQMGQCSEKIKTKVDRENELLYIIRSDEAIGWNQNFYLNCQIENYSETLCEGIEKYLLNNHLPILNNNIKNNYIYYDKNILNIEDGDYSESL
jgi:mannosyltransferase OCH1-like enzyme